MAVTKSKLEGRITVPTGGWDIAVVETGGNSYTATIAAGEYYHSSADSTANDFPEAVEAVLDSGGASGYTVSVGAGEGGTGKYTITSDGVGGVSAVSLTWTDTDARDVMGFTATQSGGLTYTSTNHARSLWLSDVAFQALNHTAAGWQESDFRAQETGSGGVWAFYSNKKTINSLTFPASARARVWIANESTTNESMEKFWEDCVLGAASWSTTAAGPIRWYPDGNTDGTYTTYKAVNWATFRPDQVREHWTGLWLISVPRMVKQ